MKTNCSHLRQTKYFSHTHHISESGLIDITSKMLRQTLFMCNRGRFSSMLDMGGVGVAPSKTRINVGKNNRVRAVALDFPLITRSIKETRQNALVEKEKAGPNQGSEKSTAQLLRSAEIKPDMSMVEKMANLLNIKIGDDSPVGQKSNTTENDDISAILSSADIKTKPEQKQIIKNLFPSGPQVDIRSKYASKLRNKIEGGVAGLDLAKSEKEDFQKSGDAQSHMAARALISANTIPAEPNSSSRWMATTGTGKLLSFISGRSMQIVLLPRPSTPTRPQSDEDVKKTLQEMESLKKQLPHVHFDLLIPDGRRRGEVGSEEANKDTAQDVLNNVLSKIDVPPLQFVVVSDRDDYLCAARETGMFSCRVRPKNARRGSVTASYNVPDVASVEGVINEINGISFNSALKG
mmetsp:Transcript_19849/g.39921  ORF Transcript_19849/g.39921 Transcript_19849/m.39921 type:complete len:407 (+) Transcript_19849:1-1221(+)